jgi:hypothetical protein
MTRAALHLQHSADKLSATQQVANLRYRTTDHWRYAAGLAAA